MGFFSSYSLVYRKEGLVFSMMFCTSSDLWMFFVFKMFWRRCAPVAVPKGLYSWCSFEQLSHFTASQAERVAFMPYSLVQFCFFCWILPLSLSSLQNGLLSLKAVSRQTRVKEEWMKKTEEKQKGKELRRTSWQAVSISHPPWRCSKNV